MNTALPGSDGDMVAALPQQVVADINTVLGWMLALVAVACVGKIVFVGARLAWDHQHTPGVESPVAAEFFAAVIGWILAAATAGGIAAVMLDTAGAAPAEPERGNLVEQIEQINPPLGGEQPSGEQSPP
ncbi:MULTISPECIES: hypothetical protein [Nocardiaceae]|uniref:hypothetical protein n=1 Tax=Nocardiaceae TaxID=85025 RepID=UPI000559F9D0|nr:MULTISPECIES: hypothetical protein [Rhodococcus]OZD12049.1 hypothetical protein CH248_29030 [Rhodococcus sp. 06-156-4a]OZD15814.1 hypothetical protein CH253_22910 [Rhodococcus sp. 06-156-3C]OZD21197.1 hypothetical protein CH280_03140 [Rhodococcus sp. 06-156-4C]OZD32380.1 hypothetical protein CH284_21075 [Rhodococcus sp. 06-156-3]OZD36602.1 hypothetical protein CH247_03495 [Rhodococcus sp. 06-156-3b]